MLRIITNKLQSMVRSVRPRVTSNVKVHPVSDERRPKYNDLARYNYSFLVDSLQLSDKDHMRTMGVSVDHFIENDKFCKICERQMQTLFSVVGRDGAAGLIKSFCPTCTSIRFTRLPTKEWYKNYFSKEFYSDEVERRGIPPIESTIYDAVNKYVNTNLPVLDIGCGFGEKLKPFADLGFSVVGVEPSEHRANAARNMLGNSIHCLTAEDAISDEYIRHRAPYGICSFFHVLEFCLDPYTLLMDLHALMADEAVLYIATGLFHTRNVMQESHFSLICSTFNSYSLQLLLEKCGFKVLDVRITNKNSTLEVVARKQKTNFTKKIDNAQKQLQLEKIKKHIHYELGFSSPRSSYKVLTEWSSGTRKAVLTRIPDKNGEEDSICFIHKSINPVMLVK